MSVPVKLIRTVQENIDNMSNVIDGCIYVATDTGRVFLGMPDDLIELAGIETGEGLFREGNYLDTRVVDIVDQYGESILDDDGVAWIYSDGGSGSSGGASLNTYSGEIPSGTSGKYSMSLPSGVTPQNIVSVNFYTVTGETPIRTVGSSSSSSVPEFKNVQCKWSISLGSSGGGNVMKATITPSSSVNLNVYLSNITDTAIYVNLFYNTDQYIDPVIDKGDSGQIVT